MSLAPIGVFDSGIGGLSILHSLRQLLPNEDFLYVADSAHAPYGPKGSDYIQQRSLAISEFLLAQPVKAIVVACNTATAAAIALLRARYPLPIIGVEPAVKPAALQSKTGVVGVLATSGTIASDKFENLQNRFSDQVQIVTRAGTSLVELIEQPARDAQQLLSLLHQHIEPMLAQQMDVLVLGCTHYSLIRTEIQRVCGEKVSIVDAGSAVAKELQRRLHENALTTSSTKPGQLQFYSNGDLAVQRLLLQEFWGEDVTLTPLTAP